MDSQGHIHDTEEESTNHNTNNNALNTTHHTPPPLYDDDHHDRFGSAIAQITTAPQDAISTLLQIQEWVARQSYFATKASTTSSETIDDVSTFLLPYLTLDHHLAMAYIQLPVDRNHISTRRTHLQRASDHFNAFLQKLEAYDILTNEEKGQYERLVELTDHLLQQSHSVDDDNDAFHSMSQQQPSMPLLPPPMMNRDAKIAQYRHKQQLQQQQERLKSLQLRRRRLHATISDDEMMDGYDQESLVRTMSITAIHLAKMNTFEEWASILQELPMIAMMIQQQQQSGSDDRYSINNDNSQQQPQHDTRQASRQSQKPMELTQITKDSMTGQLRIHRQEIQIKTFRPSWNQPTMSIEELAEREVHDAIQRKQRQEQSEAYNQTQPRRYEQLVKDGLDDDEDLVDASAALDRNWDAFKDENPRGCGNKRGDVGDRNF